MAIHAVVHQIWQLLCNEETFFLKPDLVKGVFWILWKHVFKS